jgi:DNA-binding NarL/FixJ family response regulator
MAKLTKREQEVLEALFKGFSNREMGELLNISRNTIRTHRESIYRKLGASTSVGAIYEALAHGLLQAPKVLQEVK